METYSTAPSPSSAPPQSAEAPSSSSPKEGKLLEGGVYVCQPQYSGGIPASHRQFWRGTGEKYRNRTSVDGGGSLLANTFNRFWVHALNLQASGQDIRYFGMLHDDIVPQDGWLDVLLDELEATGVDLVSAVVPIKDWMGLTSCAIDGPDRFTVLRRITMTEVFNLPETFSGSDCGYRDDQLLVNTGCWVCRFDQPWRHAADEDGVLKVYFTIDDRIRYNPRADSSLGQEPFGAEVAPEDWNFSRMLHAQGAKIRATRKVRLSHHGSIPFNNQEPWGTCEYDRVLTHRHGGRMIVKEGYNYVEQAVDVDGWLSTDEGKFLAKLATKRTVLELGSYCGRSTIWMARTANLVYAVDTFDGRGTPLPRETLTEFKENLVKYNVLGQVRIFKGETTHVVREIVGDGFFDLAFIDGSHDHYSVMADVETILPKLSPGCLLAFHDYTSNDPGVVSAVNQLQINGLRGAKFEDVELFQTIKVLRYHPPAMSA